MGAAGTLDDPCFVRPILNAGADLNTRNSDGDTPLIFAATAGFFHNVEVLLEAGADPTIKNAFGQTALDLAQKRGHQKIASLLASR
jgi:ankyrin repeat protein